MEKINITFGSSSVYRFALRVTIFDGDDKIVNQFRADSEMRIAFMPGIYTIRLELNGILKDHLLRIYQDERIAFRMVPEGAEWKDALILDLPDIYSSIPFNDRHNTIYKSSHEYYSEECKLLSQQSTTSDESICNSSLFIFFRFPNREQFSKLQGSWPVGFNDVFFLYDQKYTLLRAFDQTNSTINTIDGFVAFNIIVEPGTYYIKISQNNKSQLIPVQVFDSWHTQVFMTLGETPLYGTLRIILSREREFDPRSTCNKYIDILADKIQNRECDLSGELIEYVTLHKSESPMLAFLCIQAYMDGDSDLNDDVIGKMIKVLDQLILANNIKTPDIRVVELLAEKYLNKDNVQSREPFSGVPMLRLGVQAVSEAALEWPSLVAPNGMLDYAIEGLLLSSVFTVFDWNENRYIREIDSQIFAITDTFTETLKEMLVKNRTENQKKKITAQELLDASEVLLDKLKQQDLINNKKENLFRKILVTVRNYTERRKLSENKAPEIGNDNAPTNVENINQNINLKHIEEIKNNEQSSETAVFVADYVLNNPSMSFEEVSTNLKIPQPTVERVLSKDDNMQNPQA